MAKKQLKALESLKAIEKVTAEPDKHKEVTVAGMEAAQTALRQDQTKKTKQVGMRLGGVDLEIVETLAIKLKQQGLQYSEANAVRLALRLFKGSNIDIAKIALQIKEEDGRKRKNQKRV